MPASLTHQGSTMTGKLEGKVAVITGGNSGIGLATAKRFAAEGASVIITGRRQAELDNAIKEIGSSRAIGVQGDVANMQDLDRLYALVKSKHGHIDVIFANAGLVRGAPLEQVSEEDFNLQFNVNVKGVFFTVQKALPLLKDGGSIILNSSITNSQGLEGSSVYSATKAAVRSFARTWTSDLKERKIRVNAISPGPIATPIWGKGGLTAEQQEQLIAKIVGQVPMGRMGSPDEIASAVLFLASAESSYVTGIELTVDGGQAQI
jgi:NAD(P)-dependent dehydrogenase (short-subunit alcohol dehydrogenase family)